MQLRASLQHKQHTISSLELSMEQFKRQQNVVAAAHRQEMELLLKDHVARLEYLENECSKKDMTVVQLQAQLHQCENSLIQLMQEHKRKEDIATAALTAVSHSLMALSQSSTVPAAIRSAITSTAVSQVAHLSSSSSLAVIESGPEPTVLYSSPTSDVSHSTTHSRAPNQLSVAADRRDSHSSQGVHTSPRKQSRQQTQHQHKTPHQQQQQAEPKQTHELPYSTNERSNVTRTSQQRKDVVIAEPQRPSDLVLSQLSSAISDVPSASSSGSYQTHQSAQNNRPQSSAKPEESQAASALSVTPSISASSPSLSKANPATNLPAISSREVAADKSQSNLRSSNARPAAVDSSVGPTSFRPGIAANSIPSALGPSRPSISVFDTATVVEERKNIDSSTNQELRVNLQSKSSVPSTPLPSIPPSTRSGPVSVTATSLPQLVAEPTPPVTVLGNISSLDELDKRLDERAMHGMEDVAEQDADEEEQDREHERGVHHAVNSDDQEIVVEVSD